MTASAIPKTKGITPPFKAVKGETFVGWLLKQADRNDAIGELACDTEVLLSWGFQVESYKQLKAQMTAIGACEESFAALRMAHAENRGYQFVGRK